MQKIVSTMLMVTFLTTICAQNLKFTVETDRDTIKLGESFSVTYKIENSNGVFQPPDFNDFYLVGGPNTQSSFQMINGEVSQSLSYSYVFVPKYEGNLKLGEAGLLINGEQYSAPELDIFVLPNPDGTPDTPPMYQPPNYRNQERKLPDTIRAKKRKIIDI